MFRIAIAAALATVSAAGASALQLPERPEPVAEVMILGTYHFSNPGRDMYNAEADDMLSPRRQAEIAELLDALAAFEPTIVAVEADPDGPVNDRYAAWRAGEAELTANERQQIGFRLADRMGLDELALIDVEHEFLAREDLILMLGEQGGQADPHLAGIAAATEALGHGFTAELEARQTVHSVGEVLAWMNSDVTLDANSDFYLAYRIRRWGAGGSSGGVHTVANWYTRNLLIFENLLKQVEGREGERVLVVYGQGHAPILRHLVEASPLLTFVDPLDYLPAVPPAPEIGME